MTDSTTTWQQWLERHQAADLITLCEDLAQSEWAPGDADREAAWILYIELRTRITTQPLHYRAGDEETALDSVFQLFRTTRSTIEAQGPGCRHLATIAIEFLNTHIRPVTAKWHKKKVDGRLLNDDDRRAFRRELAQLQNKLRVFCRLLGSIAEGDELHDPDACAPKARETDRRLETFARSIPFDRILLDKKVKGRDTLYEVECAEIGARRAAITSMNSTEEHAADDQPPAVGNLVGLACSGGGIRSATFCLGVVQALSRLGVLPHVDYLSTVSGGGYFGAFISSSLNDANREKVGLEADKLPFAEPDRAEPGPLRKLRNNSKYLLKGGLLGQSRMVGLMLFGILVNLLTLAPVLLSAFAVTKILQKAGLDGMAFDAAVGWGLSALGLLLVGMILCLPWMYRHNAERRERIARYERLTIVLGLLLLGLWSLAWAMPWVFRQVERTTGSGNAVVAVFAALPLLLGAAAFAIGLGSRVGQVLVGAVGITGPLLLLMAFYALHDRISPEGCEALILTLSGVVVTVWLWFINVNQVSPHRYYRNRLAEAYLIREKDTDDKPPAPQPLSKLRSENPGAPYHLINAAVNLPGSRESELRGRNADFFLFSQHFCGSPLLGYCKTRDLEQRDPHLDLATAMAISGAAASSHMGTTTIKGLSFWLALLNVRLAYWLPNPKRLADLPEKTAGRPFALWREMFGLMSENDRFVNLSDGGHIENLAIYELLRRRCKFIIAIDGEADPQMRFPSLMKLIRFAQIDFGIRIDIDLGDLQKNADGYSKAHFVLGTIDYGDGLEGYLLYVKSSLTGNERDYILDYGRTHPSFPHETTADQFFDEAQFEAYRALGNHIGRDLMQEELVGQKIGAILLEEWFKSLVCNLLEPQPRKNPSDEPHP